MLPDTHLLVNDPVIRYEERYGGIKGLWRPPPDPDIGLGEGHLYGNHVESIDHLWVSLFQVEVNPTSLFIEKSLVISEKLKSIIIGTSR